MSNKTEYYSKLEKKKDESFLIVPCSPLDNVLSKTDQEIKLFEPINGTLVYKNKKLIKKSWIKFKKELVKNIESKKYETTDHMITVVELKIGDKIYDIMYVSLDNSVRSNIEGYPLKKRIKNICGVVNNVKKQLGKNIVVFFSESYRPSFDGRVTFKKKEDGTEEVSWNKKDQMDWKDISKTISELCGVYHMGGEKNNENELSFGISCFSTSTDGILKVSGHNILKEGFGSVVVVLEFGNGTKIAAIHFPLSFRGDGKENLGYKTMKNLLEVTKDSKIEFVFGDFNTIPGKIGDSIILALGGEKYQFKLDTLTFFGAFYDRITINEVKGWESVMNY